MEIEKYHNIRLLKAWEDYKKLLRSHIVLEFICIGIGTIANIFVGAKYGKVLSLLLYEFAFLLIVFAGLFLWKSLRVTPERIYNKQEDIIADKQKKIDLLEERQKPKLEICFDPQSCFDDTYSSYNITQKGKTISILFTYAWRLFICNTSTKDTINNVEVKLIDINKCLVGGARNRPEIHLKFTDDNSDERRTININPDSRKFVDVIECFNASTEQNREGLFNVLHTEKENDKKLTLLFDKIDNEDCKIRIEVEGEDTTCKPKDFTIGLRDNTIKMWPV